MISSQNNVRKYRTNGHEQVYGIHAEVLGRLKKQKRTICKSDSPYSTLRSIQELYIVLSKYTKQRKQDNFLIKYVNYFFSHVFLI